MGTVVDFAVKSKHLCKHLKWLKLFSALAGKVLTLWMKIGKTTFQGLDNVDKDNDWTCKDKDKNLKLVLKETLKTRTNIPAYECYVRQEFTEGSAWNYEIST